MSRTRKALNVIDIDNDDEMIVESSTPKKIDFSTRKKGQTPKKRGLFTPMKISGDVKPKLEPESPIVQQSAPIMKPKRAPRAKVAGVHPKVEPALEEAVAGENTGSRGEEVRAETIMETSTEQDVKPDIRDLESLLGGLNLEHPTSSGSTAVLTKSNQSPTPSPARESDFSSSGRKPRTPLYMSYDSPNASPPVESLELSPASEGSSSHQSPRYQAPSPVVQSRPAHAPESADLFNLFSSDSPPPPPRQIRSPSASSSSSVSGNDRAVYLSESENDSPMAGPSKSRKPTTTSQSSGRRRHSPSVSASPPCSSPVEVTHSADDKPHITSLEVLEDVKPAIRVPTTTPSSKPRRRAFLEFLDTVAKADSEPEDDYEYHLNESEGSLKDFIVDDDEVSYISDSEGSLRGLESEEENSDIVEVKADPEADSDADSDVMIEEAVSHPKIGRASGLDFLEEIYESDQGVSDVDGEADDLPQAIDILTIAGNPQKGESKAKKAIKAPKWAIERVRIAQEVFDDLDKRVFDAQLGPNGAGAKIIWNKRLLTTAGTAQRKRRRQTGGETSWDLAIQLSEKVCTGEEQVLSTVAHEMCHLACWVIDKEFKNPHGKVFKSWGRKVMRKRSDLEVTTKHDYVIEYKFHWRCIDCKKVYKRHSKSIDTERQGCGICKGKLEALFETKSRGTSTFQVYLKQNMKTAKAALPGKSHGDVMRALSARWTEAGPEADHEAHWKAVLAATRG